MLRLPSWVVSVSEGTYQKKASRSWYLSASVELKPSSNISFSIGPFYNFSKEFSQYINVFDDPYATATFNKRYVFGEMNQKTIGADIRLNWTFTPKLSLQFYAQPLISTGNYINIKELAHPKTYDFNVYQDVKLEDGTYTIDPDGQGPAQQISLGNPNFNFMSFPVSEKILFITGGLFVPSIVIKRYPLSNSRATAVVSPGSVVYFVWTQSRSESENIGDFQFNRSAGKLFDLHPDNIYMVKFTYWFNM